MKAQFSGIGITEGRGAAGDTIFSRNLYGAYTKARVPVTDPNTVPQQDVRLAWANLMGFWQLLGDDLRNEWGEYAARQTHNGRMGQSYSLSGVQEFMKVNFNILIAGSVPIPVPPDDGGLMGLGSFSCVIDITNGILFSATMLDGSVIVPSDTVLVLYGTLPHNLGRMKVTNGYRGLARLNAGEWFPAIPEWDLYTDTFPLPSVATKLFFRCAAINISSGKRSPLLWCSGIVQP